MTDEHTLALYLRDLGREIAGLAESANPGDDQGYSHGRRMALYEVISLMQMQAEAFGLTAEDVGLAGIDPNRFLM
jgi:hypothetical protein